MVKAAIHLVPLGNESLPQIARFICPKSSIITGGRGNITQESRLPVKKKMLISNMLLSSFSTHKQSASIYSPQVLLMQFQMTFTPYLLL